MALNYSELRHLCEVGIVDSGSCNCVILCFWQQAAALAFTFTLAYDNGNEEFGGIKLNRFGMQEMVENVSYFTIRPPEKSSYRLIIYAKDLDQQVYCASDLIFFYWTFAWSNLFFKN